MEEEIYKGILKSNLSLNNGMLYENAIAQCLVANNHRLFFYTHYSEEKHRNDIEIDFMPLPQDDPCKRKPDITLAKNMFDWEPKIDLSCGLDLTIEYFKERLAQ